LAREERRRADLAAPPARYDELWKWIAEETARLLQHPAEGVDSAQLQQGYRTHLDPLSWMRTPNQVRMSDLRDAFERHIGRSVLEGAGCGVRTTTGEDDWFARLLRKPRTAQHPLRHLLVMRFLGIGYADLAAKGTVMSPKTESRRTPAGEHCPNPVCPASIAARDPHEIHHEERIRECRACGMVWRAAHASAGKITVVIRGHAWDEALRRLVPDGTLSLREISRRLGVTAKSVQAHARRLGVWRAEWQGVARPMGTGRSSVPASTEVRKRRSLWRGLRQQYPAEGVKALRARSPATYTFLYRWDRGWLKENSPARSTPKPCLPRVDWAARDRELLALARTAVQALRSEGPRPRRLTRTAIARQMGHLSIVEQHLSRLPRTRAFLESITETRARYAARRLRWATTQFRAEGIAPAAWELVRRAGLRHDVAQTLLGEIEHAVHSLSAVREPLGRAS
jgi:hypothetical protein